jgi:MoaA/NifB/PqqE/SkfB family radical SAM enzyme
VQIMAIENVFLHVTKACNLNCRYCYFSASRPLPDELKFEEFIPLFQDIAKLRPTKVIFTGGEPLLRSDIHQLLNASREADRDHQLVHCLNSNGHLITERMAKSLVGLVDEVRVSVDALRDRNDNLRGAGNFDAVMVALRHLANAGLETKVLITVTRHTLPNLEDLIVFLIENGATRIKLNEFRPVGRAAGKEDWLVGTAETQEVVAHAWRRALGVVSQRHSNHHEFPDWHCGVGRFVNIMPNGDVFPCHVLNWPEFRCGNVRTTHLTEICSESGLLGALTELKFGKLASEDDALSPLKAAGTCMGTVYQETRASPAWCNNLPLVQVRCCTDVE